MDDPKFKIGDEVIIIESNLIVTIISDWVFEDGTASTKFLGFYRCYWSDENEKMQKGIFAEDELKKVFF